MHIDKPTLSRMLLGAAGLLEANSGRLSAIDSQFGDGDHGVTIRKIAIQMAASVAAWEDQSPGEFLDDLGAKIMGLSGGSAGPLWGTMIAGLALPLEGAQTIDGPLLQRMLSACLAEMEELTTARVGDKTMMDTLIPAVEAALQAGEQPADILAAASQAALQGAEDTRGYVAKYGRAKSYREQTLGTPDAGAVSLSLFFQGLAQALESDEKIKIKEG